MYSPGDAALKDEGNNDKDAEECNGNVLQHDKTNIRLFKHLFSDGLLLGLTAVGYILGGILITLVTVFLC